MKKRISERVADAWGVPKDIIMNIPRISVSGDKEIYIENHKGIAEYGENTIRVMAGKGAVKIYGKHLVITSIRPEDILIEGQLERIEYEV